MFKKSLSQHMAVKAKARQVFAGVVLGIAVYVMNVDNGFFVSHATDFAPTVSVFPRSEATGPVLISDTPFALFGTGKPTMYEALLGLVSSTRFDVLFPMPFAVLARGWVNGFIAFATKTSPPSLLAPHSHTFAMNSLTRITMNLTGSNVITAIATFAAEPAKDLIDGVPVDAQFAGNSGPIFEPHEGLENQLGIYRCAFRQNNLHVSGAGRFFKCNMNRS